MPIARDQLPDDVDALKSLIVGQARKHDEVVARNEQLQSKVLTLQEQLNLALARRYAASSEKLSPDQIRMFDEAEIEVEAQVMMPSEDDAISVPAHTRQKRGRKKLPGALPRVEIIHELADDELTCPHDGKRLTEIGEVTSEQLDIIPARVRVIRHIRKQYACDCGRCIKTAALPPQPIPKSLASPGLLATSRSRSTRMPCPCTGRRRSRDVSAWNCPAPRWRTG